MNPIKVMSTNLANMIAAGEVIERPASVVKELVENALDAKASQIKIEVNQVGLESIIVTDNGYGINQAEIHTAFLPHGTSKLLKEADLFAIKTLGFRGEALPSIASVAKVTLTSRVSGQDAYYVIYQNNQCLKEGSAASNIGTKVKVEGLFVNTPARFKYLKSEYSEKQAIIDLFDQLALANPQVAFTLVFDQKLIKETTGSNDINDLITKVIGKGIATDMKVVNQTFGKTNLSLYLMSPNQTKAKRKFIYLFVNQRPIKNYLLTNSIIEGYQTFLMTNRYPIALVYLTIDPSLVDVNTHPQKLEVKLSNESLLAFQIKEAVSNTLNQSPHQIRTPLNDFKPNKPQFVHHESIFSHTLTETNHETLIEESVDYSSLFEKKESSETSSDAQETINSNEKLPELEYLNTLGGTYLLFQNEQGLYLVDQHAAAERIRYEHYQSQINQTKNHQYTLLIPRPLNLSKQEYNCLEEYQITLNELGFRFEENTLISHPYWLKETEIDLAIQKIILMLDQNHRLDLTTLFDQLAKDQSCKGAIKANHQLSLNEINGLIKDLRKCQNPYTCPHGRPVLIKMTYYQIEKMFKRIV